MKLQLHALKIQPVIHVMVLIQHLEFCLRSQLKFRPILIT